MSLTDKSQIFNIYQIHKDINTQSIVLTSSKRKGLSLSKQLNSQNDKRSQSFIKLSARTKQHIGVQKRQIRLIVKNIHQNVEKIFYQGNGYENGQENNRNFINKNTEKCCEYPQFQEHTQPQMSNKLTKPNKQLKFPNLNFLRTKQKHTLKSPNNPQIKLSLRL